MLLLRQLLVPIKVVSHISFHHTQDIVKAWAQKECLYFFDMQFARNYEITV